MKSVNDLLDELDRSGIRLGLNADGGLRIRGDKGRLNDALMNQMRKYREQLIDILKASLPFALLTVEEREEMSEERRACYEDAYPMSALQAGMVFHAQLEQFSGIYHDMVAEHVRCPWDRGCFERALAACMKEQPILRTGFRLEGARPLQHVYKVIELPLEVKDLRGRSAQEQDAHVAKWMETRKRHEFDWVSGPLFHVHVFRRTEESFQFLLRFHHSILDGWSRAAFTTVLYNRYERLLAGEEPEPVPVVVDRTYRDFVAQEQRVLKDPAAKAYFAAMLEEAPAAQFPRLKIPAPDLPHNQPVRQPSLH